MPTTTKHNTSGPAGNGRPPAKTGQPEQESPVSSLDQAVALRDALRDAVNQTTVLITALKRERKQSKLVRSTLASLKQIQAVEV